jgi:hypothetical protein
MTTISKLTTPIGIFGILERISLMQAAALKK